MNEHPASSVVNTSPHPGTGQQQVAGSQRGNYDFTPEPNGSEKNSFCCGTSGDSKYRVYVRKQVWRVPSDKMQGIVPGVMGGGWLGERNQNLSSSSTTSTTGVTTSTTTDHERCEVGMLVAMSVCEVESTDILWEMLKS